MVFSVKISGGGMLLSPYGVVNDGLSDMAV